MKWLNLYIINIKWLIKTKTTQLTPLITKSKDDGSDCISFVDLTIEISQLKNNRKKEKNNLIYFQLLLFYFFFVSNKIIFTFSLLFFLLFHSIILVVRIHSNVFA